MAEAFLVAEDSVLISQSEIAAFDTAMHAEQLLRALVPTMAFNFNMTTENAPNVLIDISVHSEQSIDDKDPVVMLNFSVKVRLPIDLDTQRGK